MVFGKSQQEIDFLLTWYEDYQYSQEQQGAIVIDATMPIDGIRDFIKQHMRQPDSASAPQQKLPALKLQLEF
jgi:hypothetical protein